MRSGVTMSAARFMSGQEEVRSGEVGGRLGSCQEVRRRPGQEKLEGGQVHVRRSGEVGGRPGLCQEVRRRPGQEKLEGG